jgi:hypothetical protein
MKAPPGKDTHLAPQGRLTMPVWLLREPSSTADSRDTPRGKRRDAEAP